MTFLYVAAATIFQANLALSAWTIFLNTGYMMKKAEITRTHTEELEKVVNESVHVGGGMMVKEGRPRSVSAGVRGGRPYSTSRVEAKEEYYYDDDIC
jgi:hypothetical protein